MSTSYRLEIETSPGLSQEVANWYQSAVGVLCWAVELGRIDLTTETSMLAAHMAMPLEVHLIAVLGIFSYLKKHRNARNAFDPTYPEIDQSKLECRE
jgi:hypothetical protein